jgi:cation diffusion facilitator family transporter
MTEHSPPENLARAAVAAQLVALSWTVVSAITSNALTLEADALAGALEVASCLLTYVLLRLQRKSYRFLLDYGAGKLETLATLSVGLLTSAGALFIFHEAVVSALQPRPLVGRGIRLGLVGCAVMSAVWACLWLLFWRQTRRHRPQIMAAQMNLQIIGFWTAVGVSVPLLCSLWSDASWVRYLDSAVSIAIGMFTAYFGWRMIRHALPEVLDQSLSEPLQAVINQQLVAHFHSYGMLERVRSRASGGDVFIDIFLSFHPATSMGDIQTVIDSIRDGIERQIHGARVTVVPSATRRELASAGQRDVAQTSR